MPTKDKLVDPQECVWSNGTLPRLYAFGAELAARAEFPPLDTGVSAPPGVKIDISIFGMRLNLMIKIWTPFICQDGDKNCDYVKVASNSYSMKPALVLLIGIHPNGVGQCYANYS